VTEQAAMVKESTTRSADARGLKANGFMIGFAFIALVGAIGPGYINSPLLSAILVPGVISAMLAMSAGFLFRNNGQVSFGQAAYSGIAAYLVGVGVERAGVSPEGAVLLALVLPTGFAFGLAFITARISGTAFSMLTLALSQALFELATKWRALANGDDGLEINYPEHIFGIHKETFQTPYSMFLISWVMLCAIVLAFWLLSRTSFGILTQAIKGNQERTEFLGYGVLWPKVAVFTIAAFISAVSGVLFALYNGFVSPDANLHWSVSGEAVVMMIVGGSSTVWGPAAGALVFLIIKNAVGDVTEHWLGIIGAMLVVVTIKMPRGLSGAVVEWLERRNRVKYE
jgi:branched-chain amino acid transport system permease protein